MFDWSGILQIFRDGFVWALNFIYKLYNDFGIFKGWLVFFLIGIVFTTVILPFLRPNSFSAWFGSGRRSSGSYESETYSEQEGQRHH